MTPEARWRRHVRPLCALALTMVAFRTAALPVPTEAERTARAAAFRFERRPLPAPGATTPKSIRRVHPTLEHFAAGISAVGASIALADLDGDGLPNDACHVDPRFDEVRVAAVDRPSRFTSFALQMNALPYDSTTTAPMGCVPADVNADGRTDLLVYFWGRTPMIFLRRDRPLDADGYAVQEVTDTHERWFTGSATFADFDGDGHTDLLIANYFQDGAHVLDANSPEHLSMPDSLSRATNGGAKHFFLWTPDVREHEPARVTYRHVQPHLPPEAAGGWTFAVGAADLDADLLPEVYFANDFGADALLHNVSAQGHLRFAPVKGRRSWALPASHVLGRDSFKGMGVDFGDLNGDGHLDVYVSNIAVPFAFQESHLLFLSTGRLNEMAAGIAPYVDASERLGLSRSGWGWDVKLDDFDNDGVLEAVQATGFVRGDRSRWPELQELTMVNDQLVENPRSWPRFVSGDGIDGDSPDAFFARHADGRYYDIASLVGLGNPQVTRGVATADVDADGRLDLALANQWGPSFFYRNRSPSPGAFLALDVRRALDAAAAFSVRPGYLQRSPASTPAIGAAVQIRRGAALLGARQVDGGNGHSGRRSAVLHFGLGALTTEPVNVEFRWRDSHGRPQLRSVQLSPGAYTVLLGR